MTTKQVESIIQIFPREIWFEIVSSLSFDSDPVGLRSLSLVCSTLRDIAQSFLFLSCIFTLKNREYDITNISETTIQPLHTDWASKSDWERLRFITSPRVAAFVKQLHIRCKGCHQTNKTHPLIRDQGLLDRIFASIHHFTSLKVLNLQHAPIFNHHLQAICHSSHSQTRLSLMRCIGMDIESRQIPLAISSLKLIGWGLDQDLQMTSLLSATLAQTLTQLSIHNFKHQDILDRVAASGLRLEMLKVLDVSEESFALILKHAYMFPNVLHLSVYDGPGLELPSHSSDGSAHNIHLRNELTDTAFSKIESLQCPILLLPLFLGRPISSLSLWGRRTSRSKGRSRKLNKMLISIDRSQNLLSQLSTLRLLPFLDLHRDVKDFIAPLIAYCPSLRRFEMGHYDRTEIATKIQLQAFLKKFCQIAWPLTLENIHAKVPDFWYEYRNDSSIESMFLVALNGISRRSQSSNLRRVTFEAISPAFPYFKQPPRLGDHTFVHNFFEGGPGEWCYYEKYYEVEDF